MADVLKNYIGGQWVAATSSATLPVENPATGEVLAHVPLSAAADVDAAVKAAREAFSSWRQVPPVDRARYLFKYRGLLEKHWDELARICTTEHGKVVREARAGVGRGIENVEHACGIPTLMMGDSLEDISSGIDTASYHQPVGVFAAIAPYNFPAMVPLWFWPYAVATGNTFLFKPSEQVPLSQQRMMELAQEAGFPAGVLGMVHGDKTVVEAILDHPDIAGVSFVGSTPIAKLVYTRAAATGKRVQSFGGAKNHVIVMPDAHPEKTVEGATASCYGNSGQRCLAGSTVVLVGDAYDKFRDRLVSAAKNLVVGNGLESGVTMGPVISARHRDRVLSYIETGVREGATLLLDGRDVKVDGHPGGYWVGPTVFDDVTDEMTIAREEIFGPVMVLRRAETLEHAVAMVHASEFANAVTLFTQSGKAARAFRYTAGVSMMGVNIGVAAPMAFFPFGGTKSSFFGDVKAHGKDSIRFFTDQKVCITRWF
ncbi:MAG TPA: CoA-acylating methylmalonate-semialdehyde dehydrogenase [Kofleriaceae bacterium]|nr:CoA-acylating methylmalonate-semialdehyde dehydrogenase [Kofleriaceae bacterium]